MSTPDHSMNVAAEIALLRGEMSTGFEQVKGQLALIAQAQERTSADLDELDKRVSALEARRWPMGSMAAVSGAVSTVVALAAFMLGK